MVAAHLLSKSRTEFILDAACHEAEDVLLDLKAVSGQ
ncbi:type II toxin -antitoxin system TacA 1-like antitoxin [Musicola paradisiaca]